MVKQTSWSECEKKSVKLGRDAVFFSPHKLIVLVKARALHAKIQSCGTPDLKNIFEEKTDSFAV